jgi:ATP-binding cassette subfamily B protein
VLKLAKYLKPFLPSVILAMLLLFTQAISELFLPNLMGDIVNVGIQQGGIESASPEVLSQEAMRFVQAFADDEGRSLLDASYSLVDGDSPYHGGKAYSDTWPGAAGTQVYALGDVSDAQRAMLDDVFGTVTWTMMNLMQRLGPVDEGAGLGDMAVSYVVTVTYDSGSPDPVTEFTPGGDDVATMTPTAPDGGSSDAMLTATPPDDGEAPSGGAMPSGGPGGMQEMDLSQVYSLLPMLEQLPPELMEEARAEALETVPATRAQSAIVLVKAFYRELGADMGALEIGYIIRVGLTMLAVATVTGLSTILVGFLTSRIGAGLARDLRTTVFAKVAQFSHTEFDRFSTASLITRSTNDVMAMQMLVSMGLRMVFSAPITGIGAAIMAVNKSVSMSWIVVLGVVLVLGSVLVQMSIVTPRFRLVQRLTDKMNLVAREKLTGLMVVRAFNRDDVETARFDEANLDLTNTHIFIGRVMALMMPVTMIVMNGMSLLIIWFGGKQVAASHMQVGDMMAYMQYIMQVMFSFMSVSMMFQMLPRAQVSASRIVEVLDTEPAIVDPAQPQHIDDAKAGQVEFNDVSFRYESAEEDALRDLSFTVLPGQTVAFIGSTGSGKSSILNLIPRFYDVSGGSVSVGGVDVRQLTQAELRARIGYVPQKTILMGGTIATNIAYGAGDREVSYDEYLEISEVAQAIEFIGEKDWGFYSPIAQGGTNVSGGQRQRLAIARALAVHPDIYLFDDSFSALDFTTDAALRRALKQYTSDSTLLIVSQRVGTIMDADVIHVVDEGRIIASGRHEELLDTSPEYYEIASTQLAEVAQRGFSPTAQAERAISLSEGGA